MYSDRETSVTEAVPASSTVAEALDMADGQVTRCAQLVEQIDERLRGPTPRPAQSGANGSAEVRPYVGVLRHANSFYPSLCAINERLESILKGL